MSALALQHETWKAANNRLWRSEPRRVRAIPPPPQPSARERMLALIARVEAKPVGPVFPKNARPWQVVLIEVAHKHGVSVEAIRSDSRARAILPARFEAAFRMSTELDMALPAIGRRLGRDHTTILHSIRRYMEQHPESGEIMRASINRRRAARRQKDMRIKAMYEGGTSIRVIVETLKTSRTHVEQVAKRAGIYRPMITGQKQQEAA